MSPWLKLLFVAIVATKTYMSSVNGHSSRCFKIWSIHWNYGIGISCCK